MSLKRILMDTTPSTVRSGLRVMLQMRHGIKTANPSSPVRCQLILKRCQLAKQYSYTAWICLVFDPIRLGRPEKEDSIGRVSTYSLS